MCKSSHHGVPGHRGPFGREGQYRGNYNRLFQSFGFSIERSKRDGTRAQTRFVLSAKRISPLKLAGVSVQSTAGSRGVRISGQLLYRPCSDVQCKATGYPLHSHLSPSLSLPCVPYTIRFRTRYTS